MRITNSLLGLALIFGAQPLFAKTITVQMKNSGAAGAMVFEPGYVQAAVGDVVRFVPTSPSHNAQIIPGMVPDGVAPTAGQMSKPFDLKITKPGFYGIECEPHFSMGMIALIKAGQGAAPNAAKAKAVKLPPLAAKRMAPMFAAAK